MVQINKDDLYHLIYIIYTYDRNILLINKIDKSNNKMKFDQNIEFISIDIYSTFYTYIF